MVSFDAWLGCLWVSWEEWSLMNKLYSSDHVSLYPPPLFELYRRLIHVLWLTNEAIYNTPILSSLTIEKRCGPSRVVLCVRSIAFFWALSAGGCCTGLWVSIVFGWNQEVGRACWSLLFDFVRVCVCVCLWWGLVRNSWVEVFDFFEQGIIRSEEWDLILFGIRVDYSRCLSSYLEQDSSL